MNYQLYQLKKQVENFKDKLNVVRFDRFEVKKNKNILGRLYDENLFDEDGKLINNENH